MCASTELSNKKLYSTFMRTYAQASKIPEYLAMLLQYYKWKNVGIMFTKKKKWLTRKEDIVKKLKLAKIKIRIEVELDDSYLFDVNETEYMKQVKQKLKLIKDQARSEQTN